MYLETHDAKVFLCSSAGSVHVPGTLYLNEKYSNPHSKQLFSRAIRLWVRFADALDIDLAARAIKGQWLSEGEKKILTHLAFRPIEEVESLSDVAVRSIASARKMKKRAPDEDPGERHGAVTHNTAAKQLVGIADFLTWFHETVIEPRLPSGSETYVRLRQQVEDCTKSLKKAIRSTKSAHPHSLRSVPTKRFLQIYSALYLQAADIFKTGNGAISDVVLRDRAMALLAGEGMRPGAIGNVALEDFRWDGGNKHGYIRIKDNSARRGKALTTATPVQKGARSRKGYNSEYVLSIWPTTADAIKDYIDNERKAVLTRGLANRSKGFLFVADHGGPISDRSTITYSFTRAGRGLASLGLLARQEGDQYVKGDEYGFNAYLLRHSSASLFYSTKSTEMKAEVVQDLMKDRFGWSRESQMPSLYAKRAMSDAAALTVGDFMDDLFAAARAAKCVQKSQGTKT